MRLCLFALGTEPGRAVDAHVFVLLAALRTVSDRLIVVMRALPRDADIAMLRAITDEIIVQSGADAMARTGATLSTLGARLDAFDEAVLTGDTVFGPMAPFAPMFAAMAGRDLAFWSVFARRATPADPMTGGPALPACLDTSFLVVRGGVLRDPVFRGAFAPVPAFPALPHHAFNVAFTARVSGLGRHGSFIDPLQYSTEDPARFEADTLLRDGCPLLLREMFVADPLDHELTPVDLRAALRATAETGYDTSLIWRSLLRNTPMRTLHANLVLQEVLPPQRPPGARVRWPFRRIGVLAHVFHTDLLPQILGCAANIPAPHDVLITTDTEAKRDHLAAASSFYPHRVDIRVVAQNRGRDMPALFITQRDLVLDGGYDLFLRLHSKKSPQAGWARAMLFAEHLFANLAGDPGLVAGVLDLFEDEPTLGLATAPVMHMGFPTLGHAWFGNRARTEALAAELGFDVPLDVVTPIAPYGGMFWFRPAALRSLFEHAWRWEEFSPEPFYADGDLSHVLERLITPCAQHAGFHARALFTPALAARNYARLEHKLQALASRFPNGSIADQIDMAEARGLDRPGIIGAAGAIGLALRRSAIYRWRKIRVRKQRLLF